MTVVKNNTSVLSSFPEMRDLFVSPQGQDKKGQLGESFSQFWDILNKLDEQDQTPRAQPSRSQLKSVGPLEKPKVSSSMEMDASQEPLDRGGNQEDLVEPILMIPTMNRMGSQQTIDIKGKESPHKIGQDLPLERLTLRSISPGKHDGDVDYLTSLNSHELGNFNISQTQSSLDVLKTSMSKGGNDQKVQFEILPKPIDATPIQIQDTFHTSFKSKSDTTTVREEVELTQGMESLESSYSPNTIRLKAKESHLRSLEEEPGIKGSDSLQSNLNSSLSIPLMKNPCMMENAPGVNKGGTSSVQQVSFTTQKATQSSVNTPSIEGAKKLTIAEKIQALNQIRSELKAALEKGETHLKVHLMPDELGKVEIKVDIDRSGTVQVLFTADQRETMEHIAKYGQEFVQIFQESGLQADMNSMNFQSRDQSGENQPRFDLPQAPPPPVEKRVTQHRISTTQIDIEV